MIEKGWLAMAAMICGIGLSGCIAKSAIDVASLPVRAGVHAGAKAVDMMTTSQDEADRNRGREIRLEEERRTREERQRCRDAGSSDC